jgi:hypothetical protein
MAAKRSLNWLLWAGFLLILFAFVSYIFIFVEYPITRDVPWVNLLLFGAAGALLFAGLSRAYRHPELYRGRVAGPVVTLLSALIFALFVFQIFFLARQLPASARAPRVGQKAPDFTLLDTGGKQVSLAELLSSPLAGAKPKGVLLVFYRGYW